MGALFLSFLALGFVDFLSSNKDAIFMLSHFSLISVTSNGTLHLALGLDGIHLNAASIWTVIKFSYSAFRFCLSDAFRRNLFIFFFTFTVQ